MNLSPLPHFNQYPRSQHLSISHALRRKTRTRKPCARLKGQKIQFFRFKFSPVHLTQKDNCFHLLASKHHKTVGLPFQCIKASTLNGPPSTDEICEFRKNPSRLAVFAKQHKHTHTHSLALCKRQLLIQEIQGRTRTRRLQVAARAKSRHHALIISIEKRNDDMGNAI